MKKMSFIACAAMLASAVAFTGCNKSDQNEPNQKVQSVTTDITIALPAQVNAPKKMPGATVQTSASDFETNGLKTIILAPFAKSIVVAGTDKRMGTNISLGGLTPTNNTTGDGRRTKVFENQPVPMGTGAFLFYAESGANNANLFNSGALTPDYSSNYPKDYEFYLTSIQPNAATVTGDAAYTGLIAYMNVVADAENGSGTKWCELADNSDGLVDLFNTYKTAKVLSSFGVARMMSDLYKTLEVLADNGNTLATNIRTAINNATYVESITSDVVTLKSTYDGFPASVNLPDGALAVAWDAENKEFKGNADGSAVTAFTANLNPANVNQYTYPASLWYYANSKIRTSAESEKDNYSGKANWDAILDEYTTPNATVNTTTRSIALESVVQYGVARLDIQLKAAETLADNNTNTNANQITNTTGYELTGVLIGGQQAVGYDFTRASYPEEGTHKTICTIYDKVMTETVKATVADYSATKNSTLVLESALNQDVYIAIELLSNSGSDFYGVNHELIPNNGKFYLVGKLAAASASVTTGYVFKQDYTTTAKLTIGDLKSAYNTIPDLKAPSVEIGFAVDLNWTAGTTYTVNL